MAFDYYDIQTAAAGGKVERTPEERQSQKIHAMIKAAENTNYDGDPEYYGQVKALAMQAGIPIKQFKSNPYRIAKAGLLSFADSALMGALPNSMYTPQTPGEEMAASVGGAAGFLLPWGAPMRAAKGAGALLKSGSKLWAGGKKTSDALSKAGKAFAHNPSMQGGPSAWYGMPWKQGAKGFGKWGKKVPPKKTPTPHKTKPSTPAVKKADAPKSSSAIKTQAKKVGGKKTVKKHGKDSTYPETKKQQRLNANTNDAPNIKVKRDGLPTKAESSRVQALMKPAMRKRFKKLKGKARADLLANWAKQKGYNISVA